MNKAAVWKIVSEHISNMFTDGDLELEATVRNFRTVQIERPFPSDPNPMTKREEPLFFITSCQ